MRRSRAVAVLTLLVGFVMVGTCAYPTERDASVHVSVTPLKILIRGSDTIATASAWQMVGPADSQPIPNVAFVWSSSAPGVATVDNSGRIVGVNSGVALIRAAAANFDKGALLGEDTLRVTAPLEIDSVVPDTARYGQVVTVFGPGAHACHGRGFAPHEANGDSTIVAFKNASAGALHAITIYRQAASYGMAVLDGYASELPADAHEDDNSCNAADLRDTMQAPFRDTLTIENPHDVDWIRFHYINGGLGTSAQFRLHAFPGAHPDSLKDLDLYVTNVPAPGDTVVKLVLADTAAGSDVNRTTSLATGDYYLAVVDFAGTTTTYEVCVGTVPLLGGGFCNTAFPTPPTGAPPRVGRRVRARAATPFLPSRR